MKSTKSLVYLLCCLGLQSLHAEQPILSRDFFTALRAGDSRQIRAALDQGASVNARDEHGNTPLMLAAVYGDVAEMKLLLDRGAEVNAVNAEGVTPLIRAAYDYDKA